jgi:hypothetical protein
MPAPSLWALLSLQPPCSATPAPKASAVGAQPPSDGVLPRATDRSDDFADVREPAEADGVDRFVHLAEAGGIGRCAGRTSEGAKAEAGDTEADDDLLPHGMRSLLMGEDPALVARHQYIGGLLSMTGSFGLS